MKKILFCIVVALMAVLSVNAQTMKIYKGDVLVATYNANEADKVVFGEADQGKVTFELQLKSKTYNSLTFSIKPSDPEATYLFQCSGAEYVNLFDTDEELINADMSFYYEGLKDVYEQYGFSSYNEFFVAALCDKGEDPEFLFNMLDPETKYVAYVFALDPETLVPTSDLFRIEATTDAASWTLLGTGKYQEGFIAGMFTGLDPKEIDVEIYEDPNQKGLYAMKNPYGPEMLYDWWYDAEKISKEMLELYEGENNGVWKETYFTFTINDDNTVDVPLQEIGMYIDGWPTAGIPAQYGMSGTYADGVITAETKGAVLGLGEKLYYSNILGTFKITMPTATTRAKAVKNSAEKKGKKLNLKNLELKHNTKVKKTVEAEAFVK